MTEELLRPKTGITMNRPKTSPIWTFFTPVLNSNHVAVCNICKQRLSYKTSTSNLRKHMKCKHPTVSLDEATPNTFLGSQEENHAERVQHRASSSEPAPKKKKTSAPAAAAKLQQYLNASVISTLSEQSVDDPSPLPVPCSSRPDTSVPTSKSCNVVQQKLPAFVPKKMTSSQKGKVDEALLKLFTRDFQPFSIVEDEGFVEYTSALNPSYVLPGRKTLSKTWIPAKFAECLADTRLKINSAQSLCLTTDTWTSVNTDNFMAVTAHFIDDNFDLQSVLLQCAQFPGRHTAENIGEALREVTKNWNIAGKVIFVVTDNADNVVNAVKDVMGWKHMGCFAHSLNLVVTRALSKNHEVVTLIETVKRIVSHFKRSTQSTEKLIEYQVKNNQPNNKPKKLVQDVSTRWNSTYFMLKRFVLLQQPIKATLALIDKGLPVLTPVQWKMLCELILVLKPFYTVTKTVSGEKYATGSLVIPLANSLFTVGGKLKERNFSPQVKEVVTELNKELSIRFGNFESSNTLTLITFLDPRFKNLVFKNPTAAENAKERLINAVAGAMINEEQERATKNAKERPADDVAIIQQCEEDPGIASENQSRQEIDELSVFNSLKMCLAKKKKKGTVKSRAIVELDRFLEEDELEWKGDPLLWWKENGLQFPNLRKVVQKNCCCLATSVPCERAFSKAGLFVSDRRNRLSGNKTKMLMFLNANQPNNRQPAIRKDNEDRLESEEDKILNEIISNNLEAN